MEYKCWERGGSEKQLKVNKQEGGEGCNKWEESYQKSLMGSFF